jgi:hypothetical protein
MALKNLLMSPVAGLFSITDTGAGSSSIIEAGLITDSTIFSTTGSREEIIKLLVSKRF